MLRIYPFCLKTIYFLEVFHKHPPLDVLFGDHQLFATILGDAARFRAASAMSQESRRLLVSRAGGLEVRTFISRGMYLFRQYGCWPFAGYSEHEQSQYVGYEACSTIVTVDVEVFISRY